MVILSTLQSDTNHIQVDIGQTVGNEAVFRSRPLVESQPMSKNRNFSSHTQLRQFTIKDL